MSDVYIQRPGGGFEPIGRCSELTITEARPPRHVRRQLARPAFSGSMEISFRTGGNRAARRQGNR